jgi:hypothetical protein
VIALLQQRLAGWQRVEGPRGVGLWLGPASESQPRKYTRARPPR